MDPKNLLFQVEDGIGLITLNRPEKLNALNGELLRELDAVVQEAEKREDILGLVITGQGEKAFVAGADIAELEPLETLDGRDTAVFGQAVFSRIESFRAPVAAAVNGFALGGGCELAMACHLRIASEAARFGQPEVNLGLIPGYGGTQRLPRLVGRCVALELLLTGNMITAQRAYEIGLVNAVVPPGEVVQAALDMLRTIIGKGPLAVRYCIEAVNQGSQMPMDQALYLEATLFGLCCGSEDKREGTGAFLAKRKPEFKGR